MTVRIIAGEKKGTVLKSPKGLATRPTLARVRASLFMILMPRLGGARVLDCFAGSGILGLEALSRGAVRAVFVEQARPALDALRANIGRLGFEDRTRVFARDVFAVLRGPAPPDLAPFDLILLDPPYGRDLCSRALALLAERHESWLAENGIIAVQHGRRDPLAENHGPLNAWRVEHYSETRIAFYGRR